MSSIPAPARVALLVVTLASNASGQKTPAALVTGTYALGHDSDAGCWMEIAPVAVDTVRMQLKCSRGAPTHHLGFVDARLSIHDSSMVYRVSGSSGSCAIRVHLAGTEAVVKQDGSDLACGFGGGVRADGTYHRTSGRRPKFDLNPVGPRA
jgi:hypothetical protein